MKIISVTEDCTIELFDVPLIRIGVVKVGDMGVDVYLAVVVVRINVILTVLLCSLVMNVSSSTSRQVMSNWYVKPSSKVLLLVIT